VPNISPLPFLSLIMTSAMGLGLNSTVILNYDNWSNYLSDAQTFLPNSPSRVALLALINVPIIVVFLNVLRQLVSSKSSSSTLRC
jgi:hypothetical protein